MKSMTKYFGRYLYNSFSAASTGEFNRTTAVNTGEKCSKPCVCQVWIQLCVKKELKFSNRVIIAT